MIIDQFTLNTPPGRGPVELLGDLPELFEVARLYGPKSPTFWRIGFFAVIDQARGRLPTVLLTRNEATRLCRAAAAKAFENFSPDDFRRPIAAAAEDTGCLRVVAATDIEEDVHAAILTFAHTSPPRHQQL